MPRKTHPIWRLLSAPLRMMPDFIIPGEAKCGTTSLYRYLTAHPDILSADEKEPHNFIKYGSSPMFCRRHYPWTARRWLRHCAGRPCLTGEATANYLAHPEAARNIAALVPGVKLIVLMRNPVRRAFSDYAMMRAGGWEDQEFEAGMNDCLEWVAQPNLKRLVELARAAGEGFPRFLFRGVYVQSLQRWLTLFPREHFLFLKSEDLFSEPASVVEEACRFLCVRPVAPVEFPTLKKGQYDSELTRPIIEELAAFYRPYNEELYAMLGRDLGWEAECAAMLR